LAVKTFAKAISPRRNLAVSLVDNSSIVPSKTVFSSGESGSNFSHAVAKKDKYYYQKGTICFHNAMIKYLEI
jgi:hypothetical protein